MNVYTLGQAALITGKSKAAISAAIKSRRLAAFRTLDGSYEIAEDDLFKLYPVDEVNRLVNGSVNRSPEHLNSSPEPHKLTAKIEILEAKLEAQAKFEAQVLAERDSLKEERERLLGVIEKQARSVRLLTHQMETSTNAPAPETSGSKLRRKLFGF